MRGIHLSSLQAVLNQQLAYNPPDYIETRTMFLSFPALKRSILSAILSSAFLFFTARTACGVTGPELLQNINDAGRMGLTAFQKSLLVLPEYPIEVLPLEVGSKDGNALIPTLTVAGRRMAFPASWTELDGFFSSKDKLEFTASCKAETGQEAAVKHGGIPKRPAKVGQPDVPEGEFYLRLNGEQITLASAPLTVSVLADPSDGADKAQWMPGITDVVVNSKWPDGEGGTVRYIGGSDAVAMTSSFQEYYVARTDPKRAEWLGIQVKIMTWLERALVLAGAPEADARRDVTAAVGRLNELSPAECLALELDAEDRLKAAKNSEDAVMAFLALHTRQAVSFGPRVYVHKEGGRVLRIIEVAPKVTLHYERQVRDYWGILQEGDKIVWVAYIRRPSGGPLTEAAIPVLARAMPR